MRNLVVLLFLSLASFAWSEEQTCTAEGQCFASDREAAKYYRRGRKEEINFGESQMVAGEDWKKTLAVLEKTKGYMVEVLKNNTMRDVWKDCKCRNELCSFWAGVGECENNPNYMLLHCAPSCQTCHHLSFEHRCPFDKDAPTIWEAGDLNKMFERITTEEYYLENFQPEILSRPPDGPWVITLDNIATAEECERMIELGAIAGYKRSQDVGTRKFDGTFDGVESRDRTSSNAWCQDDCYKDPMHQHVLQVVENITGIPEGNSEYWQLLRYDESQFYRTHHDYVQFHQQRFQGVRILTVYVYLNDVEEGGGTHFDYLNITVQPKRGRAVVWPSVNDQKPNRKDHRTTHEALPVIKGVKYGANAWIHQRDFKTVFAQGCS